MIRTISRYVPGTNEHAKSQHEYAKRVREVTAERVSQYSEVFRQLSRSFGQLNGDVMAVKREEEISSFYECGGGTKLRQLPSAKCMLGG